MESSILLHPDRITEITRHILKIFDTKTSRNGHISIIERRKKGFNAMFAVQSVEAAKMYYNEFEKQQKDLDFDKRLRIATIFSYAPNEEQCSYVGDIIDENMEIKDMKISSKEFLDRVIVDYNKIFKTNYSTEGNDFQNYYKDISMRVKNKEIDLIIVVGIFLTGFDSPSLNTLFVDKNLRYHGLIQAYSRTNRILDITKPFGNIVCFRDLEKATKDAIKTFGDKNSLNVILEKSYEEYINGFKDKLTGKFVKGYDSICNDILTKFPNIDEVVTDSSKKEFIKLFGQLLKSENILRNYDEFLNHKKLINERSMQDYKSLYLKIRDSMYINPNKGNKQASIDLSDVEFHIELLRTSEINLDYILKLLLEKSKEINDIDKLKDEIRRVIRSSVSIMYKEELVINFLSNFNVSSYNTVDDILSSFYTFAKEKKLENINHVIKEERLKKNAKNFIEKSISKGYVDVTGTDLDSILPPTSRRNGAREIKKETVFNKIKKIVDIFLGI